MNTNTPPIMDTAFSDDYFTASIIPDKLNQLAHQIQNSQKQSFLLKNIGVLVSTILRTSWVIQRYNSIILEQQNCLKAVVSGIDDGILLMKSNGTIIIQNNIGMEYLRELCRCEEHSQKCIIHSTIEEIQKHGFSSLTRRTTICGQSYQLSFTQISHNNDIHRISLRIRKLTRYEDDRRSHLNQFLPIIKEMAAAIAHEINNPLTPILGLSASSLHDDADSHSRQRGMNIIHRAGKKIASVIRQLLSFDETYRCDKKTKIRIDSLIGEVIDKVEHEFNDNQLCIKIRSHEKLDQMYTNETYLKQVLLYIVYFILENTVDIKNKRSITLSTRREKQIDTIRIDYENADIGFTFHEYSSYLHRDCEETFRDLKLLLAELLAHSMNLRIRHQKKQGLNQGRFTLELPRTTQVAESPQLFI